MRKSSLRWHRLAEEEPSCAARAFRGTHPIGTPAWQAKEGGISLRGRAEACPGCTESGCSDCRSAARVSSTAELVVYASRAFGLIWKEGLGQRVAGTGPALRVRIKHSCTWCEHMQLSQQPTPRPDARRQRAVRGSGGPGATPRAGVALQSQSHGEPRKPRACRMAASADQLQGPEH